MMGLKRGPITEKRQVDPNPPHSILLVFLNSKLHLQNIFKTLAQAVADGGLPGDTHSKRAAMQRTGETIVGRDVRNVMSVFLASCLTVRMAVKVWIPGQEVTITTIITITAPQLEHQATCVYMLQVENEQLRAFGVSSKSMVRNANANTHSRNVSVLCIVCKGMAAMLTKLILHLALIQMAGKVISWKSAALAAGSLRAENAFIVQRICGIPTP